MTEGKNNIMPDLCSRRNSFHYTTALNLLMKMGISINNIDILAVGEYENYKGEVREQMPSAGEAIARDTKITLKIGYPSTVDRMPYQFFYGLHGIRSSDSSWEESARRLMVPFDAAVIRNNANARFQMLCFDFGIVDSEHLHRVLRLFDFEPVEDSRDIREILFWVSIFPSFHFWAGNPDAVEKVLGKIFGFQFAIVENTEFDYDIPESIQYRLGSKSGRLGHETIIGRSFAEWDSGYEVIIGGVKPEDVANLLPGKPVRKKIEWVLSFCMPSNLDYRIKIDVERGKARIGTVNGMGYLGYSSYLKTGRRN